MGTRPGGFGSEDNWFDRPENSAERELALESPDERLPWLESDDDGDEVAEFFAEAVGADRHRVGSRELRVLRC